MAGPWYRLTWVRIGGVVFVLGLAVALAVPFLIPVDRFRPLFVRSIEANTGRQVQIDALTLHLVPTVHIHAVNVRVKNPPGFPQGDAIIVKSVDLGIALRALLSRRLDVTYIAVSGVRANLLHNPTGRTNFELPAPPGSVPPGTVAAGSAPFLTLGHVGTVTVTNVEIAVANFDPRNAQVTPSLTLSGLNARIRSFNLTTPDWQKRLEIASFLRGVKIVAPLLAQPVQFQTGELLVKDGGGRGTFSATLDNTRVTGTVAIASLDPLSVITFTVAIPELDVGGMKPLAIYTSTSMRRLLARGEVKIARLVLSPFEATQMSGRLSVYTNTIQLDSYALSAYAGTIQGAAVLDYSATNLPLTVTTKVRGINVERVASTLSPETQKVTGALDADLKLATALGRDPKAALRGGGTFAIRDGSFPGMDLTGTMVRIAKALQYHVPSGDTRFSYCGGDLRFAQQRGYSNDLRLHGEGLEGTARGSFGLNKTLDYAGTAVVQAVASKTPPSGGGFFAAIGTLVGGAVRGVTGPTEVRAAFSLSGTFDKPKFTLTGSPGVTREQSLQPRPFQPTPVTASR